VPELSGLLPYQAPATPCQAMVLAGRISAAAGIRVSMADPFKAPTAGDTDRQLDRMTDARK
jgi:hypothetical protein